MRKLFGRGELENQKLTCSQAEGISPCPEVAVTLSIINKPTVSPETNAILSHNLCQEPTNPSLAMGACEKEPVIKQVACPQSKRLSRLTFR